MCFATTVALFLVGSGAKESTADPPPLLSARRLTRLEYALTEFVVHDGGREAITQPSQAELDLIPAWTRHSGRHGWIQDYFESQGRLSDCKRPTPDWK
eukprot:COSAG03_NODE_896_length_5450_cov_30.471226_4_plen_98_part_00